VLIAYIKEVQAAEASAPGAASARQAHSRQRAASVDSDSGNASEAPSPQQPRKDRPRQPAKPPRRLAGAQAVVVDVMDAVEAAWPSQDPMTWFFPAGPLNAVEADPFDLVMLLHDFA
jgi:hypothetical protein